MNNIQELKNSINSYKEFIAKEEGKKEKLLEQKCELEKEIKKLNEEVELLEKVAILLQKTSDYARIQATNQIESLVTKCLQFIFSSNIEFLVELEELRGRSSAEFYVVNELDNMIIKTKPELSRGGGVVDIVSLALRISFLELNKPKIEGPLILDEPAKHVSNEYIYNVAEFLKQTSEMFNRQIIMVTHDNHLASIAGNSYRVELEDYESVVSEVIN